jgi:polyribonucleotide nucleotidyltransferase
MASVCGGCMALMDAGVPIKATCAGISVGRFSSGDKIVHVTDILGEEDFFGDMDFKICGTREGITGIQLDLKARGLWFEEIKSIFAQAHKGRIEIIEKMEAHLGAPREEMSPYAPKLVQIKIDPDKIGKLIGPGGKMIRGICERTGASVDVDDDGTVTIASTDQASGAQALAEVEAVAAEIKVGTVYEGKVVSTKDFGAFIEIATGTDGMCHISELDHGYVANVSDVVSIGDVVKVKVINVDPTGRIKLSRKALLEPSDGDDAGSGGSDDQGDSDGGGNRRRRGGRKPAEAS